MRTIAIRCSRPCSGCRVSAARSAAFCVRPTSCWISSASPDYADEEARNLPFGHQRRLEIARALALRPKLLLLDEPAAGLTHGEIEDLKTLIRQLVAIGITVILVEHHVEMVMTVSDHVTVLDYGKVIASGTAAQVQCNPQVIEAYFGAGGGQA